jgi:flagellar biogenesis protein FliO
MQLLQFSERTVGRKAAVSEVQGLAGWVLGLLRGLGRREAHVKQMELVETLALGGKRQLMLVSCGGERFLVGGGVESVEAIVRLNAVRLNAEGSLDIETERSGEICQ